MNPGRELDALIAEKVMGWETPATWPDVWNTHSKQGTIAKSQFCPSTDIAAAFPILNCGKLESWSMRWDNEEKIFIVQVQFEGNKFGAYAPTAPHAICLAALKAVGHG